MAYKGATSPRTQTTQYTQKAREGLILVLVNAVPSSSRGAVCVAPAWCASLTCAIINKKCYIFMWERGRISTRGVGKRAHLNAGWPAPGCETVPGCGKEGASQRGVAGARVWKRASSSTRGQLREQLKLRKSLREGDKSTSLHDFTTGRPAPCTHYAHLQCRRRMCMHRHASPPHSCMTDDYMHTETRARIPGMWMC